MTTRAPILVLKDVRKSYGPVAVLHGVDFEVCAGEVVALLGENGAGKSTLSGIIAGSIQPSAGTMTWQEQNYSPANPKEALDQGVGLIHQELRLLPHLSIAENVFVGRYPLRAGRIDRKLMEERAHAGLRRLGLEISPRRKVGGLSTDFDLPQGEGSNAVAMGKAVTASGRGLLLGNPHYPWQGSSRFHMIHTTIPGELDVMGASLYTTNRVAIGFNKDVAWSHTVSTGLRSTIYALDLNPADATQYKFGNGWRTMTRVSVTVPVKGDGATLTTESQTVYLTHYGPVVVSDQLPWTTSRAYAIRDVNLSNDRNAVTYDALNKARSIDDVEAAISLQGVSWTNTLAAGLSEAGVNGSSRARGESGLPPSAASPRPSVASDP